MVGWSTPIIGALVGGGLGLVSGGFASLGPTPAGVGASGTWEGGTGEKAIDVLGRLHIGPSV